METQCAWFHLNMLESKHMDKLIELLYAYLGMFDRTSRIAHDVRELGCKTTAQHHHTTNQLGDLMGKFDDVKAGIQANTQQAAKAQAEIRTKLDELLAKQQEVEAAVAAALAADAATDEADFDAKMNELQGAVNEQKAAMQALDDVVPDAPANPTEPTEPGTPTEPNPPVDPNEPPPAPPTDTPAPV